MGGRSDLRALAREVVPLEQLVRAVGRLDRADRAALNLSVLRSLSDTALAEQLGLAKADAKSLCERALGRLASELGVSVSDAQSAVAILSQGEWRAAERPSSVPKQCRPRRRSRVAAAPTARRARGRKRGQVWRKLATGSLVVGAALTSISVFAGGESATATAITAPSVAREASVGHVEILRGARPRLIISAPALAGGREYRVWLFNSIADSRSLGIIRSHGTLEIPLPAKLRHYEYIDVARESAGGKRAHSGRSVLRASTEGFRSLRSKMTLETFYL
jgi:anti-sigma-K factor RskA